MSGVGVGSLSCEFPALTGGLPLDAAVTDDAMAVVLGARARARAL